MIRTSSAATAPTRRSETAEPLHPSVAYKADMADALQLNELLAHLADPVKTPFGLNQADGLQGGKLGRTLSFFQGKVPAHFTGKDPALSILRNLPA